MIDSLLGQILGWLGFLQRPVVLQQLLLITLMLLLARRQPAGRHKLPFPLRALPLLLLATVPLALAGQPTGLVLLMVEVCIARLGLLLLERSVLAPRMPADAFQHLRSRLLRPVFLLLVVLGLLNAVDSLGDLAAVPLGVWFGSPVSLGTLTEVVLVLYLLVVGSGTPAAGLSWLAARFLGLSQGSRRALELVLRYVMVSIGILWALDHLGFNRTGLLAVAGGLSVGLGFGVKEIFSNFISGLWLLFEGSVRPGEVLIIDGQPCEVRQLGLRATTLWRGNDNAELMIPNQSFFTATTTSFTRSDRTRRCALTLQVSDRHSPRQIMELLESIAREQPGVLAEPAPKASLQDYGPGTFTYQLGFSVADPLKGGGVTSALRLAVCEAFVDQEISFSQPTG
ncbi:MAG: mechanosensitive ion channel family protein [Synechococcus sp.]